jgi:hypothetical protein
MLLAMVMPETQANFLGFIPLPPNTLMIVPFGQKI